ncbi:MAG: hypothetical protein DRJ50_10270 [Actinobacteria bacterium]|nr:MAG: hypothetical protein DRJ50_10270 [Actinomycetota bacterium]
MRKPETLGQAIKRAWKAPPARFANWLDKMGSCKAKPVSKAAEAQRRHDARMVKRMRKALAKRQRDITRNARSEARA